MLNRLLACLTLSIIVAGSAALAAFPNKDITLNWDAPTNVGSGLDHYTIYTDQCVPGGQFYVLMDRDASLPRSIVITNVPPGTCRYRVTAVDSLGQEGPVSNVTTATVPTPPPAPSAPLNLTSSVSG